MVVERLLHRRQALGLAEALDRGDLGAVDGGDRGQARAARLAVDEDGAGAAAALLAAGLRARDVELVAEDPQERRERRARDLVLDPVDGEVHDSSSRSSASRTRTGRTERRYARGGDGVVDGLDVLEHRLRVARRLDRAAADGGRPDSRNRDAKVAAVLARAGGDGRDEVGVGVPPAHPAARPDRRGTRSYSTSSTSRAPRSAPRGSPRPARPLAAAAGRADPRAERDQRSAEVAALRLAARRGRRGCRRWWPSRRISTSATMDGEVGKRSVGKIDAAPTTGVAAPIVTRSPSTAIPSRPLAVEHQRARRREPAGRDLGKKDRAAGEDGDSLAVAEERSRLVGGGRDEHVGSHGA